MDQPIITVSEGKIQGTTLTSVLGQKYLAFKGIPYAQPPVGPLRFEKPQPPTQWSGIRDASKHAGDMAVQMQPGGERPYDIYGDEDCLYLNVYTNAIGHKRPILLYIHGGNFVEGTGNDEVYREDYFVIADLILITVNFRLGPLGFLSVGHEVSPGNQGVRDIILAMEWVQKNAEAFGGDPNNVTIFGNSSGSMTCHLLTLIPAAKGLFHKAILQSGTMFEMQSLLVKNDFNNGFKIAKHFGLDSEDPVKVIEFLRTIPARELVGVQGQILSQKEFLVQRLFEYGPEYDFKYTKNPIIPAYLEDLLENDADIPIIIGNTVDESLLDFMGKFDDPELFEFYDANIEEFVKNMLRLKNPEQFGEIMNDCRRIYLKNQPINRENAWNLIRLMTDLLEINLTRKITDLRNKHAKAPTYVYRFSYLGNEPTIYQFDEGPQPLKGVAHADELSYMFYLTYIRIYGEFEQFPERGSKDYTVMERFIRMWYNFAATGNPTPDIDGCITTIWKPSTDEIPYYLDIGDELQLKKDTETDSRRIYDKFKDNFLI